MQREIDPSAERIGTQMPVDAIASVSRWIFRATWLCLILICGALYAIGYAAFKWWLS